MIERLDGMPEGVDGFKLVGEITRSDYEATLVPWIDEIAESEREVRAVILIGDDFSGYEAGAAWEDAKLGVRMEARHRDLWKRIALVTEVGWVRRLFTAFGWMVPGEVEVFDLAALDGAKEWAAR